jgi:hypothetical protein
MPGCSVVRELARQMRHTPNLRYTSGRGRNGGNGCTRGLVLRAACWRTRCESWPCVASTSCVGSQCSARAVSVASVSLHYLGSLHGPAFSGDSMAASAGVAPLRGLPPSEGMPSRSAEGSSRTGGWCVSTRTGPGVVVDLRKMICSLSPSSSCRGRRTTVALRPRKSRMRGIARTAGVEELVRRARRAASRRRRPASLAQLEVAIDLRARRSLGFLARRSCELLEAASRTFRVGLRLPRPMLSVISRSWALLHGSTSEPKLDELRLELSGSGS